MCIPGELHQHCPELWPFLVRHIYVSGWVHCIHQEWQYASLGMGMSLTRNAHTPWEGECDSLVMQIFRRCTPFIQGESHVNFRIQSFSQKHP